MQPFDYHRPKSLSEAAALLAQDEDAKLLAGGQSLLPVLKMELAAPTALISLRDVSELSGIRREGDTVIVGAASTHAEVSAHADVRAVAPAVAELAGHIGDAQVRNLGTLGGSVAHADPAADYPAAILGLAATVETNTRRIAADDYFTGLFETALEPGEIVKAVHFPKARRSAYAKFANPASKYAIVGVFVAELADGSIRLAVTGAAACAFRVTEMEAALGNHFSPEAVAGISVPADELNDEIGASRDYRAHLVTVMAKRAVAAVLAS